MLSLRKILIFIMIACISQIAYAAKTPKKALPIKQTDGTLVRAMKERQKFPLYMVNITLAPQEEYEDTLKQAVEIAQTYDDYVSWLNAAILHALQNSNESKNWYHLLDAEKYAMFANMINLTETNNAELDMESEWLMGHIRERILFPQENLRELRNQSKAIKSNEKDVLYFLKKYERYGKKYPSSNLVPWDRMGVYYRALGKQYDAARCEQNARRYIYSDNTTTIQQVQDSLQDLLAA